MLEKLNRGDWRWILAAIVVATASLLVVARYFHRAFPQAAIDFQISGQGSTPLANSFLQARGLATAGYLHAEEFEYDDAALTFLERSFGLTQSEGILRQRLPAMWRWQNRWFKPLTREEFQVAVSTSGQIVGFDHTVSDAAPGAKLAESDARVRAEQFLTNVMHAPWPTWVSVGTARTALEHRTDYVFTWRDADLIGGAEHRHVVRVQGSEIGGYDQFLKVPEAWTRGYDTLRSKNELTGEVDTLLLLVLAVGMLVILVMRIRRVDIRWRPALWVGGAGATLSFLAALNSLGAARFGYDTTQSWPAFLSTQLLGYLASAVGVGVFLLLLTAAAESLYRERFRGHLSVGSVMSWQGVRSKAFFLSLVLGLALAAFFFAYQTVFYLIANHFGAWAPADIPYDDLLNTKLPWAFVLFSGFFPAISEEFGFRMLAIPLFEKWFRYVWVAVIAASFLWGFGHATYPNQPFYIRGLEVGLGGVLLSWVMIRFGILTTVVWHYTVDALYTAMLLLRAHNAYLLWSGAATAFMAVAPLLIALIAYWRCHGFVPHAELTNAAAGSAPPPVVSARAETPSWPAENVRYLPIPGPNWTVGLIVSAALLSAFAVPTQRWATVLPWRTTRTQAVEAARRFLQTQGLDPGDYRVVATQATALDTLHGEENQVAAAMTFTHDGRRPLLAAFSGSSPTVAAETWQVRFYRYLQTEEFLVAVRADTGAVSAFAHIVPEAAPGGAPAMAAAQATAAAFLKARGMDVSAMTLRVAQQQRRAARTDTTLVWESAHARASGGATYRTEVNLDGDAVAQFTSWYYVPEAEVRAFERGTLGTTLLSVSKGLLYAAAIALIVGLLYVFVRRRQLSWAPVLKLSLAGGAVTLAVTANGLAGVWAAYPTTMAGAGYRITIVSAMLVSALGGFLITLLLTAPLAVTAPGAAALTRANARWQLERETAWDALWVGLLSLAWTLGWTRVQTVITARWHQAGRVPWPTPPDALTHTVPGLSDILASPLHALWVAAGLGILLPVLWKAWHTPAQRIWCLGAIALLWIGMFPAVHTGAQFGQAAIFSGVGLLLLFGFGYLFLRDSPLAYLSAALVPILVAPAADLVLVPAAPAPWIGSALLAMAGLWLLFLAWVSLPAKLVPDRA